jgi:hypothetical protein
VRRKRHQPVSRGFDMVIDGTYYCTPLNVHADACSGVARVPSARGLAWTLMVVASTSFGCRPMRLINLLKVAPSVHGSLNVALSHAPAVARQNAACSAGGPGCNVRLSVGASVYTILHFTLQPSLSLRLP